MQFLLHFEVIFDVVVGVEHSWQSPTHLSPAACLGPNESSRRRCHSIMLCVQPWPLEIKEGLLRGRGAGNG